MQKPRLLTRLCVPLLAGYVLLGLSGRDGLVLCIGSHGHVALEAEAHSACAPCESALAAETCHCAPCVDIPLAAASDAEPPSTGETGRKSNQQNAAPAVALFAAAAGTAPVPGVPAPEPFGPSPFHASLRSVVLLL